MTRDLRLVVGAILYIPFRAGDDRLFSQYQVDCVPDHDGEVCPSVNGENDSEDNL